MKLISGIVELKKGWFVRVPYPMTEMEFSRYRFGPLMIPFVALGGALGAPAATAGATGLMAAGLGVGALGQIQAGQAGAAQAETQQAMMDYNARLQKQRAREIEARTGFEQRRHAEAGVRLMSSMRAGMGAAGVIPSAGTPLLVQAKQVSELELENLMIGYEGQVGAGYARSQAALDRMQGKIYGQRARSSRTAGYLKAGTTLLSGFA